MKPLNLDQLRTFLVVIRLGGLNKAAQALNLSQPAVTARIKNLEQAIGSPLFDRGAAGLTLTREGELLARYAERFEHLAGLVERHVIDERGREGFLRIGASETVAQAWLPDFVSRLHRRFPAVQVEINVDISVNLRQALLDREIDLAFLLGPVSEHTVDNLSLPEFDLAWYVAAGSTPPDGDVARYLTGPVITYHRQTRPYRELKRKLLDRVGPDIRLFPSSSLSACFRLVEAGIGVAPLPRALGAEMVARGTIEEFDPGWIPDPLFFTASFIGEPRSHLIEEASRIALEAAREAARKGLGV